MEKTRAKKGEKYWHVRLYSGILETVELRDLYGSDDTAYFEMGNYFYTKDEAVQLEKKLRAVLKGADVIEMPSKPLGLTDIKNHHLRGFVPERLSINDLKAFALGFREGCDWLASKTVK